MQGVLQRWGGFHGLVADKVEERPAGGAIVEGHSVVLLDVEEATVGKEVFQCELKVAATRRAKLGIRWW